MGYSYDRKGRLACDACDKIGGVRKRTCPYRVHYADGSSLPYCPAPALCAECFAARRATLHDGCEAGATASQAREDATQARIAAGEYLVSAAWGSWYPSVPPGKIGVCFRGQAGERWALVPESDYSPGQKPALSDYASTEAWESHPV